MAVTVEEIDPDDETFEFVTNPVEIKKFQKSYTALGINPGATDQEIKKAYRELSLKHHPDKPGGNQKKFEEISAAQKYLLSHSGTMLRKDARNTREPSNTITPPKNSERLDKITEVRPQNIPIKVDNHLFLSNIQQNITASSNNRLDVAANPVITDKPTNNTPTISQIALGAGLVGALAIGTKAIYIFYKKNFGKDASQEKIAEAKSLISAVVKSDQDFTKLYDKFKTHHDELARELNSLYDQRKQNTPQYGLLREELNQASLNKEVALDLENRTTKLKENFKELSKANLKKGYVDGLIQEYHAITEGYDKLILNSAIKKEEVPKQTASPKSPKSHTERIENEKLQKSLGRSF